jgi:hypothetical protein
VVDNNDAEDIAAQPPNVYRLSSSIHHKANPPNALIFGEIGAGTSSLVNMIAGRPLIKVRSLSFESRRCAFENIPHSVNLEGKNVHQRTVSMLLKLSKAFIKVVKYRKITIFMTPNVNEYIGTSRWLNDLK